MIEKSLLEMAADLDKPLDSLPRARQPAPKPEAPKTSAMSAEWRQELDEMLAQLNEPVDDKVVESAVTTYAHIEVFVQRMDDLHRVAANNVPKANEIRDAYRCKDVLRTPAEAKAKLKSMAIQERFAVPDDMARNMQALVSYYNSKGTSVGKRYKTERIGGPTSMLMVWRTR